MNMQINDDFYNQKHRPYYICAPGYARVSNGVRAVHLLCHYLNKMGEEAYVFSPETDDKLQTPYLTQDIVDRHKRSGQIPIVVYPEVVHGNPLNSQAVVRYILNHPGLLGGPKDFPPTDMMVFWQEDYVDFSKYPNPSYIWIPSIDTSVFNNKNNPNDNNRHRVLVYPGRYKHAAQDFPQLFETATVITYDWPQSHEELAALLRQGKVLYAFANSAIVSEALLCGCPVVIKETVFTKKPDDRPGETLSLMLPGVTYDDSEAGIQMARTQIYAYHDIYKKYQIDLQCQLKDFIAASQKLPQSAPNEIVFPSFKPQAAPADPEQERYEKWIGRQALQMHHGELHAERMVQSWNSQPHFIILMPLTLDKFSLAMRSMNAMAKQLYKRWQLIFIADFDAPADGFQDSDVFGWLRIDNANDPVQLTQAYAAIVQAMPCDWVSILPVGTELEVQTLLSLGDYLAKNTQWLAIYCDSDQRSMSEQRISPAFKPDFNLDYFLSVDYVGQAVWFNRDALLTVNGFAEHPGADCYDAILRIYDHYGSFSIGHIANVLVHFPYEINNNEALDQAKCTALSDYLARKKLRYDIRHGRASHIRDIKFLFEDHPLISVIILDVDQSDCLLPCIAALQPTLNSENIEVLAVGGANHSIDGVTCLSASPNLDTIDLYKLGAAAAKGEYLLFLDSRIEVIQPDWLEVLLGYGLRQDVGAVVPRLLNADGETIWRGPYLLGMEDVAAPLFVGEPLSQSGYLDRQWATYNPQAASIACMLVEKSVYDELGGLDADFVDIESSAIDFCLRMTQIGKLLVWTPQVSALRHVYFPDAEDVLSPEGKAILLHRWSSKIEKDPSYNHQLSLESKMAFQIEDKFTAEWDPSFHERSRILSLYDGTEARAFTFKSILANMTAGGYCLSSFISSLQRFPSWGELARLAPDVIVVNSSLRSDFLAWLHQLRMLRPDIFIILLVDNLYGFQGSFAPYSLNKLRSAANLVDRVISYNSALTELIRDWNADVHFIPETLEDSVWDGLISLRHTSDKPRVGCICANEDIEDLLEIKTVIVQTAKVIDWIVVGECPDELRLHVTENHEITQEDGGYPQKLASLSLDLAVMPMLDSDKNRFSDLRKVLELGRLGIPIIASKAYSMISAAAPITLVDNNPSIWLDVLSQKISSWESLAIEGDVIQEWVVSQHGRNRNMEKWVAALKHR